MIKFSKACEAVLNKTTYQLHSILSDPRFELSISQSQNEIYFSNIPLPKKSHVTFFAIQNFVQNTKKHT